MAIICEYIIILQIILNSTHFSILCPNTVYAAITLQDAVLQVTKQVIGND